MHGGEVLDAAGKSGLKREQILDFSSSVNPLGPSKKALEAAKEAFSEIPAYPDSNSTRLRQAIASHFSGIDKNNVVVGNGSTELMYLFAEAFLKKGEVALIPAPTFGEYESAVRKTGETAKFVKLDANFNVDAESFIREMVGAKIVFLCNPNNPTSLLIPNQTLTAIVEQCIGAGHACFSRRRLFGVRRKRKSPVANRQNQTLPQPVHPAVFHQNFWVNGFACRLRHRQRRNHQCAFMRQDSLER